MKKKMLTFIKQTRIEQKNYGKKVMGLFLCDCGNKKEIEIKRANNAIRSCGCLKKSKEVLAKMVRKTHGFSHSIFYGKFRGALSRCTHENDPQFFRYGGRGIKMKWKKFEDFKKDMYPSYKVHVKKYGEKQTTLERINVNGNYCKENCTWATIKEQNRNKTNAFRIEFRGQVKSVATWAEEFGISRATLKDRVKSNWPIELALTMPTGYKYVSRKGKNNPMYKHGKYCKQLMPEHKELSPSARSVK